MKVLVKAALLRSDTVNVLDSENVFDSVSVLEFVNVLEKVFDSVNVSFGGRHLSIVVPLETFQFQYVLFLYVSNV